MQRLKPWPGVTAIITRYDQQRHTGLFRGFVVNPIAAAGDLVVQPAAATPQ